MHTHVCVHMHTHLNLSHSKKKKVRQRRSAFSTKHFSKNSKVMQSCVCTYTHPNLIQNTTNRCASEKYRLDQIPTEVADDADPKFLARTPLAAVDKATMTAAGGSAGGAATGAGGGAFFFADVDPSFHEEDEMLYMYP